VSETPPGGPVRPARPDELPSLFPDLDARRVTFALASDADGAAVAFAREAFDSELFGLEIGRVVQVHAPTAAAYRHMFESVRARATALGYDQVLRRTSVANLPEVWGLEGAGFELMDVGVTFARRLAGATLPPQADGDLEVAHATEADVEAIATEMVQQPWGSRYEADPAYAASSVRELRARWLRNSFHGRAQAFFVGRIDGRPAGYVTCLIDEAHRTGEIELVGTLAGYRGRRVASRVIDGALRWFAPRVDMVTVRTQATNIAAATLYERAGFTLHSSDLTFRAALTPIVRHA
jgi:RimJ/RimL family protein N-acetyltransferase